MIDQEVNKAKNKDLLSYVISRGFECNQSGGKYFISSPFSRDSNWSFCVYPATNSFFDFSTGIGGDLIELVRRMEDLSFIDAIKHINGTEFKKYTPSYKQYKTNTSFWKDFDYTRYLNHNNDEIDKIKEYARSRNIYNGYECGVFFTRYNDNWVRHPSLMFLHRDLDLSIVGAKFRKIVPTAHKDGDNGPRFSHRGKQGLYILENFKEESYEQPTLYLVESETSANSLWQFLNKLEKNSVVISFGGVSSAPKEIPSKYKSLKSKLIIDYDGDQELYNKRLIQYEHLNVEPVKLMLSKGEDINSLFVDNKIDLLLNLI